MPTCHKCRKKMHEGFTNLEFNEKGFTISLKNVPCFSCSCGESQLKAPIAKYVSALLDQVMKVEKEQIPIKGIAISLKI